MKKNLVLFACCALMLSACCCDKGIAPDGQWTPEKANAWYEKTGWKSGCDFIPSTAINQIEMWQSSTYDRETIDRELGWAEELGFNTMRTYLSSVVYANEPETFKANIDDFLAICDSHGIKPLLVFFDDCWAPESQFGPQPEPKPGVHNSGWVRDPSHSLRADTLSLYPALETYMKDILNTFKNDKRVLMWDLYNEPGGNKYFTASLPLLKKAFQWAREVRPAQPLTAGVWNTDEPHAELNKFMLEESDVVSYHNYNNPEKHQVFIDEFRKYGRPMFCTEYMARRRGSLFTNILPMLKEQNISAINWGLVAGKTNTIFAWDDPRPDETEPELWFHDILRKDKTPFSEEEIVAIKAVNGVK